MNTETEAVASILKNQPFPPQVLPVKDEKTGMTRYVMVVPDNMTVEDFTDQLRELLPAPERRTGTTLVKSIDAFLALVNRWKSDSTVVYADDATQPVITAVVNDHRPDAAGTPGFRDHRIVYQPALSDEWKTWTSLQGKWLTSEQFAELLEDRALDLVDPSTPAVGPNTTKILNALNVQAATPSRIAGLARSLTVCVNMRVKDSRNLQSGEGSIMFESSHTDEAGKPLEVPGAFLLGIPIYKGGPGILFVVRLRYDVKNQAILWKFLLSQTDLAKRETMETMIKRIGAETAVVVVEGQPG